jgi:hypothetical protein
MQRNSVEHVIDRFKERFNSNGKEPFELTNEDFDIIHKMCKDDSIGYGLFKSPAEKGKASAYRKIIFYKDIPMWVVFTTSKRKPKTIFPVRSSDLKKFNLCLT